MQLLRMRREQKRDLILLARWLLRQGGVHYGKVYKKNAGIKSDVVQNQCPSLAYLLKTENLWLRDYVLFYQKGWGWRVRKNWKEVVRQIECSNERIYERKVANG